MTNQTTPMSTIPKYLTRLEDKLKAKQTPKAAWKIIDEYFSFMDKQTIHQELWMLTVGTVTNDLMNKAEKGMDRHDTIFFYEYTKLLFDALSFLHDKHKIKKVNTKNKKQ